jgi:ribosomal protein S18 acetylase RimI-like enzyme
MRRTLDAAIAQGQRRMRLYTPRDQARARAFYEREGFERRGDPLYEPMLGLVLISYRRPTRGAP